MVGGDQRERAWWYELRRWVVNDVAQGIPWDGKPCGNYWLNPKVLRLLKEIKQAEYDRDLARAAGMRSELTTRAQSLDIPLAYGASVVVPNVTPRQISLIYKQFVCMLQTTDLNAWEKQALNRVVRVVRATPHTVEAVFSKLSTKKDWAGATLHLYCAPAHCKQVRRTGHNWATCGPGPSAPS